MLYILHGNGQFFSFLYNRNLVRTSGQSPSTIVDPDIIVRKKLAELVTLSRKFTNSFLEIIGQSTFILQICISHHK
jgi:hypothetical protein